MSSLLRLGTRGSLLAKAQSALVADAIERANAGVVVELVIIKTTGDRVQDRPLHEIGGKGLFTKELELALLAGEIDLAVHSFKDVPVTMPLVDETDLLIAAVPEREDARDVLVSASAAASIDALPAGATVGTGSLRRRCQILERRPDLNVIAVRGNIDTRIGKVLAGEFDAVVLAAAGVRRAGLFDSATMAFIPADQLVPAPGQGALALQTRRNAAAVIDCLRPLHNAATAACVEAERQVVLALDGDCKSPIGAWATLSDGQLMLTAILGSIDGSPPVCRATGTAVVSSAIPLARDIAARLR